MPPFPDENKEGTACGQGNQRNSSLEVDAFDTFPDLEVVGADGADTGVERDAAFFQYGQCGKLVRRDETERRADRSEHADRFERTVPSRGDKLAELSCPGAGQGRLFPLFHYPVREDRRHFLIRERQQPLVRLSGSPRGGGRGGKSRLRTGGGA